MSVLDGVVARRRVVGDHRSHITILVHVVAYTEDIKACLESIARSGYQQYDVVILDGTRHRAQRRMIGLLVRSVGLQSVYHYRMRKVMTLDAACREGYKRSAQGEFACVITPAARFTLGSLEQLVRTITLHPHVQRIDMSYASLEGLSVQSSVMQLRFACRSMLRKTRLVFLKTNAAQLMYGSAYARAALQGNRIGFVKGCSSPSLLLLPYAAARAYARRGLVARIGYWLTMVLLGVGLVHAATTDENQPLLLIWAICSFWLIASILQAALPRSAIKAHLLASVWVAPFIDIAHRIVVMVGVLRTLRTISSVDSA